VSREAGELSELVTLMREQNELLKALLAQQHQPKTTGAHTPEQHSNVTMPLSAPHTRDDEV
jgi:hypothetical protein